jgi:hypothetical protein
MTRVVEHLPSKLRVLNSNPSTIKIKFKKGSRYIAQVLRPWVQSPILKKPNKQKNSKRQDWNWPHGDQAKQKSPDSYLTVVPGLFAMQPDRARPG